MSASDQASPRRTSAANSTSTSTASAAASRGNVARNGGRLNGVAIVVASSLLCHILYTGTYQKVLPPNVAQSVDKVVLRSKEQLNNAMVAVARLFASATGGDSGASGAASAFEAEIPELTNDAELQAALQQHSRVFLMAYAPWCGHCKAMKPAYVDLKNLVNEEFSEDKIRVYRYNAVKDKCENCRIDSLSSSISGFPTLLMIHPGPVLEKYESNREAKSMLAFIKDSFEPPRLAETADQVKEHVKKDNVTLINYFQKPAMNLDDALKKTLGISKSTILFVDNKDLMKEVNC
ncbi:MAG: Protein disulfide-isomerase A3, variant 2, partial [Marteilia pararefringens]